MDAVVAYLLVSLAVSLGGMYRCRQDYDWPSCLLLGLITFLLWPLLVGELVGVPVCQWAKWATKSNDD